MPSTSKYGWWNKVPFTLKSAIVFPFAIWHTSAAIHPVHWDHYTLQVMRSYSARFEADNRTRTRTPQLASPLNLFCTLHGVILGILPIANASSPRTQEDQASQSVRAFCRMIQPIHCRLAASTRPRTREVRYHKTPVASPKKWFQRSEKIHPIDRRKFQTLYA